MPNVTSPNRPPTYRRHKATGQAVVTIDGRDFYLGKYRSAASHEAYRRLVAEWMQHGGKLPVPADAATVTEIIVAYLDFAAGYYVKDQKPGKEVWMIKSALKILRSLYGRTPAAEFGPLALKAVRDVMISNDWCRNHVNQQVGRIKRMFKWATENEMIPGSVCESLRCVAGLRRGRTPARESRRVKPIPDTDVAVTIEYLPAVVADMVQIQRLTGARPGEVCDLRPGDINRTGDVWEYIPQSHKTEHHDRPRVIFIGPKAQKVLLPYLLRAPDAYCFSPREAEQKRRAALHEARAVPLSCGNVPGSNRKTNPRRTAGEKYDNTSYGRAIRRAAVKAGVGTWSPHRLRHSAATEIRKRFGLEAAQTVLGHSKADVTQVYAERDYSLAANVIRQIG